MPTYIYRSEALRTGARRGRRAMQLHPDRRTSNDWEMFASDMIADILHGLNSRVDLARITPRLTHQGRTVGGVEAILARALDTWNADFEEEPQ